MESEKDGLILQGLEGSGLQMQIMQMICFKRICQKNTVSHVADVLHLLNREKKCVV